MIATLFRFMQNMFKKYKRVYIICTFILPFTLALLGFPHVTVFLWLFNIFVIEFLEIDPWLDSISFKK